MIESIELACGRTPDAPPLILEAHSGVTIFVGPNNCGKSALLEALHKTVAERTRANNPPKPSALKCVRLTPFNKDLLQEHPSFSGRTSGEVIQLPLGTMDLDNWISTLQSQWQADHGKVFRQHFCIWMNGAKRLAMLPDEQNANLQNPSTPLARLFVDNKRRASFQKAVFEGIGHYPVIDSMENFGTLKLAFSTEKPISDVERSLNDNYRKFLKKCISAPNASDGFNAYVGMLGTLHATDHKTILIDEPEAFLHPALARTLGKQIAKRSQGKHVYIATHSAEFLMGAVEAGVPVRIIRLQYQNNAATACLLDSDELKIFMHDPLLRSANVLSGLFSRSVVVTEADTDRAFYQEINTRLLSRRDARGIENALFLNAQNKQTVPRIVGLLRKMGVPCAGVVDLDVVSEGGTNWTNQATSIGIPVAMRTSVEASRRSTFDSLKAVSKDNDKKEYKRNGGINLLEGGEKEAAEAFLSVLGKYGLFVVPTGEIESWLPDLDIPRAKYTWLRQIFEKMGTDPMETGYVNPSEGDVWDFIGSLQAWLNNQARKGMEPTRTIPDDSM